MGIERKLLASETEDSKIENTSVRIRVTFDIDGSSSIQNRDLTTTVNVVVAVDASSWKKLLGTDELQRSNSIRSSCLNDDWPHSVQRAVFAANKSTMRDVGDKFAEKQLRGVKLYVKHGERTTLDGKNEDATRWKTDLKFAGFISHSNREILQLCTRFTAGQFTPGASSMLVFPTSFFSALLPQNQRSFFLLVLRLSWSSRNFYPLRHEA